MASGKEKDSVFAMLESMARKQVKIRQPNRFEIATAKELLNQGWHPLDVAKMFRVENLAEGAVIAYAALGLLQV